jgi:hypothetical protein
MKPEADHVGMSAILAAKIQPATADNFTVIATRTAL